MKKNVAERIEKISYAVREVVEEAKKLEKQGKKVYYMNIGDPIKYDFTTPKHLHDAVIEKKHFSGYGDSIGLEEAKQAIVGKAKRDGMRQITQDDILITSGGSEGIIFSIGALMNPGENILIPKPDYPLYTFYHTFFGGKDNFYYLNEEDDWQPDVDGIRKQVNEKTKAIVVVNPNNPTGSVYSKKILQGVVDVAAEHDLIIISDDTYERIIFDGKKHVVIGSIAKEVPVVTLHSMSKVYLVPGWRLGWMVFHDPAQRIQDYKEACKKLARARLSSVHHHQFGIKAGLEGDHKHVEEMVKKLQKRRDITYKRLNEINGISCVKPEGAFYAFPRIDLPIKSDKEFILDLLHEEGVLFVHGSGFGQRPGTHHFRVVFLAQEDVLDKVYDKLEHFMNKHF